MTIKCDQCKTGRAEYEFWPDDTLKVTTQIGDLRRVQSVPSRAGLFCDDCLCLFLVHEANRLGEVEKMRWQYLQEAKRREAAGDPFHCSECGRASREWVWTGPGKGQPSVGFCYACLYSKFRNDAFLTAARIANPIARLQAIVGAMERAKLQARYVLDFIWKPDQPEAPIRTAQTNRA
jgi:hypothetical protein